MPRCNKIKKLPASKCFNQEPSRSVGIRFPNVVNNQRCDTTKVASARNLLQPRWTVCTSQQGPVANPGPVTIEQSLRPIDAWQTIKTHGRRTGNPDSQTNATNNRTTAATNQPLLSLLGKRAKGKRGRSLPLATWGLARSLANWSRFHLRQHCLERWFCPFWFGDHEA